MDEYTKLAVKDFSPQKTIYNAKKVLSSLGLNLTESEILKGLSSCYSVRTKSSELLFCTNGKGITKELALASSYAEFIERLQNGLLLGRLYGLKNKIEVSDKKYITEVSINDFLPKNQSILKHLCSSSDKDIVSFLKDKKIVCEKYFNVDKNCFEFLPADFINLFTSSTGMCAGNTPEEAIVQGICEIFERYMMEKVHKSYKGMPNIPHKCIKDKYLKKIISNLKKIGYRISIKDCTCSGDFPVLGVVITHKKSDSYCVRFGSHPVFSVALQRCFTEIFQGIDSSDYKKLLRTKGNLSFDNKKQAEEERWRQSRDGSGKFSYNFINSKIADSLVYKKAFLKICNNKEILQFLIGKLKEKKYTIYIRSLDYIGFPTFKIYIPKLASGKKISKNELSIIKNNKLVKTTLLNLARCTSKQAVECAEILSGYLKSPAILVDKNIILSKICNVNFKKDSDFLLLCGNYYYFLAFLYFRGEKNKLAAKYILLFLKESSSLLNKEDFEYYTCVAKALQLKSKKMKIEEIQENLLKTFNNDLVKKILFDLSSPEKAFDSYVLPECGKECSMCSAESFCGYKSWKKISTNYKLLINKNSKKLNIAYYRGVFELKK